MASRLANWEEVRAIVNAVGETGKGIFEIAGASERINKFVKEISIKARIKLVRSGPVAISSFTNNEEEI